MLQFSIIVFRAVSDYTHSRETLNFLREWLLPFWIFLLISCTIISLYFAISMSYGILSLWHDSWKSAAQSWQLFWSEDLMRAASGGAEVWVQTVEKSNFSFGMTGIDLLYLSYTIQEGDSIRIYSGRCLCKIKAKHSMAHFGILQNKLSKNKLNIQLEDSWKLPMLFSNGSQKVHISCSIFLLIFKICFCLITVFLCEIGSQIHSRLYGCLEIC